MRAQATRIRPLRTLVAALCVLGFAACSAGGSDDARLSTAVDRPDPQCSDCYVVNAAITGNDDTLFIGGYVGESTRGFVRRYQDGAWGTLADSEQLGTISALWANQNALFFTALDGVHRLDLASFEDERFDVGGGALWGSAGGDVLALERGVVHRFDGEQWRDETLALDSPQALTGSSGSDVYALDGDGQLAHFDGDGWSDLNESPPAPPNDLWSVADDDLLAVSGEDPGTGGTTTGRIMRYDGARWEVLQEAPDDALLGVAASSDGLIYAVGGSRRKDGSGVDPVIWRFADGTFRRHVVPDLDVFLRDVFCGREARCYAVGTDNVFVNLGVLD